MNGRGIPFRLRVLWRVMVAAERVASWCRAHWVKWHDTGGAILPAPTDITPTVSIRRPGEDEP